MKTIIFDNRTIIFDTKRKAEAQASAKRLTTNLLHYEKKTNCYTLPPLRIFSPLSGYVARASA